MTGLDIGSDLPAAAVPGPVIYDDAGLNMEDKPVGIQAPSVVLNGICFHKNTGDEQIVTSIAWNYPVQCMISSKVHLRIIENILRFFCKGAFSRTELHIDISVLGELPDESRAILPCRSKTLIAAKIRS